MDGNLNAAGLLLLLALTAYMTTHFGKRPASVGRVLESVVAAFYVACIGSIVSNPWCPDSGAHPSLITIPCLALNLIFVNPERMRAAAAMTVIVHGLLLETQSSTLVGSGTYAGNPEGVTRQCRQEAQSKLGRIRERLGFDDTDAVSFPAGWLAETALRGEFPAKDAALFQGKTVEIEPFWHSWLTGLYHKSYTPTAVWYPGGRLKEALPKLAFRERGSSN